MFVSKHLFRILHSNRKRGFFSEIVFCNPVIISSDIMTFRDPVTHGQQWITVCLGANQLSQLWLLLQKEILPQGVSRQPHGKPLSSRVSLLAYSFLSCQRVLLTSDLSLFLLWFNLWIHYQGLLIVTQSVLGIFSLAPLSAPDGELGRVVFAFLTKRPTYLPARSPKQVDNRNV